MPNSNALVGLVVEAVECLLGLKAHRWGDKTKGGYWYLFLVPTVLWVYSMDVKLECNFMQNVLLCDDRRHGSASGMPVD